MLDFHNKVFVCTANKNKVDVTTDTTFFFKQNGQTVQATYSGGKIIYGVLIGMVNDQGIFQGAFNHQNTDSQFHGGTCTFRFERQMDMDYSLYGVWNWAENNSVVEELILEEL